MSAQKPPSNTKFLIAIGLLMALIMVSLIIFSPSLVGVIVDTNQTANETKIETQNQTELIIKFFEGVEKNRDKQNNTTQQILANQAIQIRLLKNDSNANVDLLNRLEAESKAKQVLLEKLENESKAKQMLLDNQAIQLYYLKNQTLQNQIIIKKLEVLLNQTINLSAQNLNISKQHIKVAEDHDNISKNVNNITANVDTNLYRYGENSVKELNDIKMIAKEILNILKNNTKT